jgi:hypothetical protein
VKSSEAAEREAQPDPMIDTLASLGLTMPKHVGRLMSVPDQAKVRCLATIVEQNRTMIELLRTIAERQDAPT